MPASSVAAAADRSLAARPRRSQVGRPSRLEPPGAAGRAPSGAHCWARASRLGRRDSAGTALGAGRRGRAQAGQGPGSRGSEALSLAAARSASSSAAPERRVPHPDGARDARALSGDLCRAGTARAAAGTRRLRHRRRDPRFGDREHRGAETCQKAQDSASLRRWFPKHRTAPPFPPPRPEAAIPAWRRLPPPAGTHGRCGLRPARGASRRMSGRPAESRSSMARPLPDAASG